MCLFLYFFAVNMKLVLALGNIPLNREVRKLELTEPQSTGEAVLSAR
jgi:hypothetical protein